MPEPHISKDSVDVKFCELERPLVERLLLHPDSLLSALKMLPDPSRWEGCQLFYPNNPCAANLVRL